MTKKKIAFRIVSLETSRSLGESEMKNAFFKLDEKKKKKIFSTALAEFSQKGFMESSFNGIIQKSGISKGGMYKYCSSKEELYHYIVETTVKELIEHVDQFTERAGEGLHEMLFRYTEHEFDFYLRNREYSLLHSRVFMHSSDDIDLEIKKNYQQESAQLFYRIMGNGRTKLSSEILKIYQWVLVGLKTDFYKSLSGTDNLEKMKEEYKSELQKIFDILKNLI